MSSGQFIQVWVMHTSPNQNCAVFMHFLFRSPHRNTIKDNTQQYSGISWGLNPDWTNARQAPNSLNCLSSPQVPFWKMSFFLLGLGPHPTVLQIYSGLGSLLTGGGGGGGRTSMECWVSNQSCANHVTQTIPPALDSTSFQYFTQMSCERKGLYREINKLGP